MITDGDPALLSAALGDIAKARGMTQIAKDADIGRESLYRPVCAALASSRTGPVRLFTAPAANDLSPPVQRMTIS